MDGELSNLLALLRLAGVTEYDGPCGGAMVRLRLDPAFVSPNVTGPAGDATKPAGEPTVDEQLFGGKA